MAIQYTATDFLSKLYQNNYSYTNAYKKKVCESNENVENLQVDVAGLKKTVKVLGKSSKGLNLNSGLENLKIYYKKTVVENKGMTGKTRVGKEFQNLAKIYNSLNMDAEKVSDAELEKQMKNLEKLFDKNEKDLKKIGFKKKDNKYVFDNDAFEDADSKVINKLLEGKDSFIRQTDKIMRKIDARLEGIQYSIVQRNMMRTTKYDKDEVSLASSFSIARDAAKKLGKYGESWAEGTLSEEGRKEVKQSILSLINTYDIANNYETEDCNRLIDLYEGKKEDLAKVGMILEEDSDGKKTIRYDEVNFDNADFKSAYVKLFGEDSEFVKNVNDCCDTGFKNILKPENVGVSIIDAYV